jgi:Xaa-Pro dipeptidase
MEAILEHIGRIKSLQSVIKEGDFSGVLLFYSRDIFYYTRTAQPSYLFISPQDYRLFIRAGFDSALLESKIEKGKIREERQTGNVLEEVFSMIGRGRKIGTELDVLPTTLLFEMKRVFKGFEIVDISPLVLDQRKRKDDLEIIAIKKACNAIHKGHERILSVLRDGITELELAAAVENAHRLAGHQGTFFVRETDFFMGRGILASGPNLLKISGPLYSITGIGLSPSIPLGPSRRKIREGDSIVVDIPVLVDGYHADQTRTYVIGKPRDGIKKLFNSLKEVADYLIDFIKPGLRCSEAYEVALKKAEELKVARTFLNFGKGRKSKMIGHGIGLEINEPPILSVYEDSEIPQGSVLALEMHMMDEELGVVKLEDMILIGEKTNQLLTKTPRKLFEVQ